MAESVVIELLKTIGEKVGSDVWGKIVSAADIDSQIKGLQEYKNTIEAALLDAYSQECSHSQRNVLEKLEGVLAKLIDFQDEKAVKAKQKQLMSGNKFTKEVRLFCSTSNQLTSPLKDAGKIKDISGELSRIPSHAQIGTIFNSPSLNQTQTLSNVSGSYMSTDLVIGRDGDRDKMVGLLLDDSAAAGVLPVASIIGMGGVGKTTLAQYVYNDERIKKYFDLQLWVFATQYFNVKDVLRQMVTCATDKKALNYDIDQLKRCLYHAIAGKRFLLVLDGVWEDDRLRTKWKELTVLLRVGAQGSQVLITTRSNTVARIIGTQDPLMVSDLGDDDSLLLFRHVAVTQWHEPGVEAILKQISEMCPKVPLIIQAIGSLLAGKPTVQEWQAFRNAQLANFTSYGRDVLGSLKLSYDQLGTKLKLCVLYCSLFPKGFLFAKSYLIPLWIAMGYVEGEYTDQNLEKVAEGYVLCLLNRGFFYSDDRDRFKCPDVFWMHNLMHDLVLSIGGFKYKMADSNTNEFDERVCHVSYHFAEEDPSLKVPSSLFKIKQLKSFLLPLPSQGWISYYNTVRLFPLIDISIFRIQSLRVLRMRAVGIKKLPRSLGKLIHLRYLDFSHNSIRKLPDSITHLVNLYFLDLSDCLSLEELPEDINKLMMLRHLYLSGCDNLSHMPKGLRSLTGLEILDHFIVGKPRTSLTPCVSKTKLACDLADLGYLDNLKGELKIVLGDRSNDLVSEAKAVNLDKKDITEFTMDFRESRIEDEMVLENLKPGAHLEHLCIKNYGGKRLPSWMGEGIHCWLPNVKSIFITDCKEYINICSFGRLPHLEILVLKKLDKVEYIENDSSNMVGLVEEHPSVPLFPSLRNLTLWNIPELKGWWNMPESAQDQSQNQLLKLMPAFPRLEEVKMDMELVISMAQVFLQGISSLHTLVVGKPNDVAEQRCGPSNVNVGVKQRQPVILLKNYLPTLRLLSFDNSEMEHIPEEYQGMSSLTSLRIYTCKALESIPEWIDSLTSLESISIHECPRLKSLPHEISNLSNLKTLSLTQCSRELAERCESPSGEDWPKIQHIPNITIKPAKNGEK
ncbi:disease resistance protein RGA2-like [Silene latifolia]|uniref:disease resistance protein RGA2-like n=1 Tax=Silene latifolia TaxID=37657 RepID=UPI003D77ED90